MGRKRGDSDGYESTHISMFAVVTHLTDLSADYPDPSEDGPAGKEQRTYPLTLLNIRVGSSY